MIETVIDQYDQHRTAIRFKLFGHTIHTEWYPKYEKGSTALLMAVKDAESRFANKLRESMLTPSLLRPIG